MSPGMRCELRGDDTILVNDDLKITFRRTIRAPDNKIDYHLPPDLATFPLQRVSQYPKHLPIDMTAKGGLFFPMYQREAMWIKFESSQSYLLKIYVGGVNVISGEPAVETSATQLRRQTKLAKTKADDTPANRGLQDYLVIPNQPWLDGIATSEGKVRQFIAMPQGKGYSVEAQMTGQEITGGLQFEITPFEPRYRCRVLVCTLTSSRLEYWINPERTVWALKEMIEDTEGIPCDVSRMIFSGTQLDDNRTLAEYGITHNSTLHLVFRLRGGGGNDAELARQVERELAAERAASKAPKSKLEMGIAPGGKIKQVVKSDTYPNYWVPDKTTVFNVQILNAASYKQVTGHEPPPTPIDAATYAKHGYPLFNMYEEQSSVHGNFGDSKSVAQIEKEGEDHVEAKIENMEEMEGLISQNESENTSLTNPSGPLRRFRTWRDMEEELRQANFASF